MEQLSLAPTYERSIKNHFSEIGLALLLAFCCQNGLALLLLAAIPALSPSLLEAQPWIMFACSALPLFLVGIPLACAILRPLPKVQLPRQNISAAQTLLLFCICCFFGITGTLVPLFLHTAMNLFLPLGELFATPMSPLSSFVFLVLLMPVFEELFFRKFLIDRIAQYGQRPAVLLSGLLFGLFQGDLQQALCAALLGFVFGFAYIKSGKLRHSILLHMLVNFFFWLLTMLLMPLAGASDTATAAMLLCFLVLLVCFVIGLIFFCIRFKKTWQSLQKATAPRFTQLAFNNLGMCFFLLLMGLAILLALLAPEWLPWAWGTMPQ